MERGSDPNVAIFLRVINGLENIRASDASLNQALAATAPTGKTGWKKYLDAAKDEIEDAIQVLEPKRLHRDEVKHLESQGLGLMKGAMKAKTKAQKDDFTEDAINNVRDARNDMCIAGSDAVLCP